MKKIFNFTKKKKGSPSASDTGSVLSVGYDLKEKDLGKVHKAAFTGDVSKLRQLAKKNDLNQLDKENRTALHVACVHGHTEVVQFLVESKVKLNLCDNQNRSALMKAVQCQQDRCVSILLEHEADPNLVDINGNTALHLAARIPSLSVALQLLEHEANINAQNKEGNTPLALSVEENHTEMAELLLKEGADVNVKNQEQRSSLMIAACSGQISMVRLLLQYNADITVKDDKGWSSDDYAVMNGHHACSHLIIEHGTKRKALQSPSHLPSSKRKQTSLLGSPEAGFSLGGPALDKDAAEGSSKEAGKDTEDNSHADSISRASKSGPADSWPSTDEDDELDLSPKKPQKVNLKKLMSASKRERKEGDEAEMSELPCGSKQDTGSPESPAEESEEGEEDDEDEDEEEDDDEEEEEEDEEDNDEEEDDDDEEEEDEEEEEDDGDDNAGEEDEEDEESGGEKEEQEDADVAKIQVPDKGIEDPEMAKFTAVKGSEEILESGVQVSESDLNAEAEVQAEQSAVDLLEEDDVTRNVQSGVIEETGVQEESAFNERAECENIDKEEVPEFTSDVTVNVAPESPLCPSPAPRTLDVEDDCLVSAIRVESRISDEEEVFSDHFSNPTGALRTPLQSSGSTPRNNRIESNYEDDGEDEDWDDGEDEELLEVEKSETVDNDAHFEADTPEFEKANVASVQSQSDEGEIGDEEYPATSDLNLDNGVVLHDGTGGDDDDDGDGGDGDGDDKDNDKNDKQEEINDTKKSSKFLTLLGQKEEPESSDNSWDSVSDKEKAEEIKDGETLAIVMDDDDTNKNSLLEDNRSPLETTIMSEDGTVKHQGDEEHIPVSMIVGNDDDDDDNNQSDDSEHCLNVSDKEEDKNQDSDSDVQQMQYDFASRTVKVTEISNSDDSQDNSLVEETGDIQSSADNHSEDQQNTVAKLDESSSEDSLPNPTSPSPVHSALHSPSPSRFIHCPSEDNDQESQITVVDRFIDVKHPSPNLSSLDGIDDCFGLAEETKNDLEAEKEEHVAFHEDIPHTDIDDVDLNSHSDEDAVKEEHENLSSEEHLDESVMHQNISERGSEQENVSSEDESEEDDVAEDDDKAETDHDEEGSEHDEEDDNPQKAEKSQDKKRDFMSELGIEKEDEEEDSPWDSESGSDSPRKKTQDGSSSPTKSHKTMASICEENNEVLKTSQVEEKEEEEEKEEGEEEENEDDEEDEEVKNDQNNKEKQPNLIHREPVSVLSTIMHSKGAEKKTDFMEELGLGDVDDLEDASDWDSASTTSKASKNIPACKLDEELAGETPVALPVVQEQDPDTSSPDVQEPARPELKGPSPTATPPLPNPRTHTAHPGVQSQPQPQPQPRTHRNSAQKPESDEESDWDTNNTSSPTKATSPLPNIVKTETATPPEDGASECSSDASEPPDMSGVAKADDMKVKSKSTALWESSKQPEVEQEKVKKAETNTSKPIPEQEGNSDRGSPQKDDGLEGRDSVSPRWQTRSPRRYPSSRYKTEKSGGELEMADDFEDLTQSSDTATEELDSAASGYRHASLLINQLDSSSIDSVSMVKLQNMFREYEHTIQRERSRHSRLVDKVSQLEQERSDLRLLLEETRDNKSSLEHLRLELETDLNNLKFLLKQEQEKHQSASMLYDKTREQLRRKEEQHRAEAEERQKVELNMRNLELEMRALMNTLKQLEEDRNETQRLLAHERSARALQEELLNSHLRKQQDIEEENLKNLNKSNEVMSQLTEVSDRERELQQQVCTLQEELSCVRAELDRSHCHSQQEESRLSEERDALRERLEDARRDLKLNEEALTQTVFQYNGQLSALKAECSVVSAKLEHERQTRQQLEAEAEASRARLQAALQETERCQVLRTEAERALQRERDEHQRAQDKRSMESGSQRDTIQSLSQKLSKAEARANSLENECHRTALSVTEKGVLLETVMREREQAQARLKELEAALQSEREQSTRTSARHEAVQERLAQAQSEAALLRQQLEEANNKGTAKERAATDAQERFADVLNQLRADGEERVQLVEERSKELAAKNAELREQNYKLEQEKGERESSLRQLQQELADSLKKLSMCEASLEVNTRYRNDLEEEKVRTQKELDRLRGKLQESEEQYVQGERRINSLKGSLDEKEREVISTGQKLQEVLAASTSTEQTIKQLEEAVQRLEIENARLEAAAKQQTNRIEVLQKEVQEANVMRHRFEDLVTNLQSSKMTLEDQLSREMQKQSMLSHNAQDSQALWEEELKSRSRIGLRLAELEKEKGELSSQMELEKKKAKKIAEQKKAVDSRLDEEMKRNTELQKEMYRLRTLVKTAKKKLREQDGGELASPFGSLRGETGHRHSEAEGAISRMKSKVDDLQVQLEREASRCSRLEEVNKQLKEQLGSLKSLRRSHECLERSKRQLEEEVTGLRRQVESGLMDQSQAEQYRRETEERARQEIRHKLEEVNLFLQTQAASQEALEQIKAANEASQRAQLEQRIKELEGELSRVRTNQQDSQVQRDSSRTELERYKQLYTEELRLRKSFAAKLDRSNERLAEANTKLLSERQRSKSLLTSSIMNGSLAGPGLDAASLGSVGAYGASLGPLNRSLGLGSPLLGSVGEPPSNRVEAYLAKMQSELEKNISKELDCATAELDGGSARMSPVGSASGSQKNLNFNMNLEQQDPLSRATQQYLEVLKKNYMI